MTPTQNNISSIEAPTGVPGGIKVYRKGRKCLVCKKKLNRYTPGPFCLSHEFKGALMKIDEDIQSAKRAKARYWKKIAKKARERKRKRRGR